MWRFGVNALTVLALMNVGRDPTKRGSSNNFLSDLYSVELYRKNFRIKCASRSCGLKRPRCTSGHRIRKQFEIQTFRSSSDGLRDKHTRNSTGDGHFARAIINTNYFATYMLAGSCWGRTNQRKQSVPRPDSHEVFAIFILQVRNHKDSNYGIEFLGVTAYQLDDA